MKKLSLLFLLFFLLLGCAEDLNQPPPKDIDEGAERAKELIDKYSERAKKFLENENGELDRIKELIDTVAAKSQDIEQIVKEKGPEWKQKMEEIKDSPEFKKTLEQFEGSAKEILEELEKAVKDLEKTQDPDA